MLSPINIHQIRNSNFTNSPSPTKAEKEQIKTTQALSQNASVTPPKDEISCASLQNNLNFNESGSSAFYRSTASVRSRQGVSFPAPYQLSAKRAFARSKPIKEPYRQHSVHPLQCTRHGDCFNRLSTCEYF